MLINVRPETGKTPVGLGKQARGLEDIGEGPPSINQAIGLDL